MTDFIAYAIPNMKNCQNYDYFFEKDYNKTLNRKTHETGLKLSHKAIRYDNFDEEEKSNQA